MTEPTTSPTPEVSFGSAQDAPTSGVKSPLLMIILVVLAVFALGMAGFMYWQNRELQKQVAVITVAQNQIKEAAKPNVVPTTAADPTAGWKTYTNSEYGYSIKYPENFTNVNNVGDSGNRIASSTDRALIIYDKQAVEPALEKYIDLEVYQVNPVEKTVQTTATTLNRATAVKVNNVNSPFDTYIVKLGNDKGYLQIMAANVAGKKAIADQILSTVKFIDTNSALKPADAQSPAAGICAGPLQATLVNIDINVDTPNPRCVKVTGKQQLQITNNLNQNIKVAVGQFNVTVKPQETQVIGTTFGSYLAPGVHFITVDGGPGPEIWLQ